MITFSKNNRRFALSAAALFITLGLGSQLSAQSHDGHDHGEEKAHNESHDEHAGHDEHVEEAEHDEHAGHDEHAEEAGHDEHAGHGEEAGGHEGHDEHEEGVVKLSPEVLREFSIQVGTVSSGKLHEEAVLPGEIKFNREQLAYVTPRYSGTVQTIQARLADVVKKGQVLATLESTETLRPFEVKAPFDGVVTAYEITPGQTVDAGVPLFTVANLSTVWADLRIYQGSINQIDKGQTVLVDGGHAARSYRGEIAYIAPVIDEHTRTGLARIIVPNTDGKWKPGQFIKGSVAIDSHEAGLLIPRASVLTHEGKPTVFIETAEGFEPRPVELGHSDSESYEVTGGLKKGDRIVLKNPISLKAELGKGSFGGHNH